MRDVDVHSLFLKRKTTVYGFLVLAAAIGFISYDGTVRTKMTAATLQTIRRQGKKYEQSVDHTGCKQSNCIFGGKIKSERTRNVVNNQENCTTIGQTRMSICEMYWMLTTDSFGNYFTIHLLFFLPN